MDVINIWRTRSSPDSVTSFIITYISTEYRSPYQVAIILTDGKSVEPPQTVMEALRASAADINMLAIGVGAHVDLNELEAIASDPMCLNLFLLRGFDEVEDLKYAIERRTCAGRGPGIRKNLLKSKIYSLSLKFAPV